MAKTEIHFACRKDIFTTADEAIKTGDAAILRRLLREFPWLASARDRRGLTLLHRLCEWPGHCPHAPETGQALIAAKADIDARAIDPVHGETALQMAASNDDAIVAELLLDAGASADGINGDRRPLAQAIWHGGLKVAELLVERGAQLDLELSAGLGRTDLLTSFFDKDGILLPEAGRHWSPVDDRLESEDGRDERIEQALVYAIVGGSVEAAEFLLNRGADIRAQPSGFDVRATPLHWAVGNGGSAPMVELLIRRGADIAALDRTYGSSPSEWAERMDGFISAVISRA